MAYVLDNLHGYLTTPPVFLRGPGSICAGQGTSGPQCCFLMKVDSHWAEIMLTVRNEKLLLSQMGREHEKLFNSHDHFVISLMFNGVLCIFYFFLGGGGHFSSSLQFCQCSLIAIESIGTLQSNGWSCPTLSDQSWGMLSSPPLLRIGPFTRCCYYEMLKYIFFFFF